MNTINYLWRFKPDENNRFPMDTIKNNKKFIENYKIITPSIEESLINNDTFHNLSEIYNLIPHWVIKTDLLRLLVIYFYGGIYSDADCFIKKSFNTNNNSEVFLFTEFICDTVSQLGSRECKNPENILRVANFCFGTKIINHPFFKEVIDECINRLTQLFIIEKKTNITQDDILWVCGPDVITTIYHRKKKNYNIFLHNSSYLEHKCYGSWR